MNKVLLAAALASSISMGAFAAPALVNGSFEESNVAAGEYKYSSDFTSDLPDFAYNVTAAPWSFSGGSGIAAGADGANSYNSPWGSSASDGANFAFLQNSATVSQSFTSASNSTFTVSFDLAQRTNWGDSPQTVKVTLDGHQIWAGDAAADWHSFSSQSLTLAAGEHTLAFTGTDYYDLRDTTALVDNVRLSAVAAVPEPETYAMLLAGLGLIGTMVKRRGRKQA